MDKLVILVLLVVNFGVQSDATVQIPYSDEYYTPSSESAIPCIVTNETFLGWYKENTKIQEYPKEADIGDKPGVFSKNGTSPGEMYHVLVLPANSPVSIGGTYQCRGKTKKSDLSVVIMFNLANLKLTQTLHFGKKEQIVLGASSYPATKFVWNKDGKPLNYDGNRITLEKDGSLTFSTVKASDGGSYEVKLNWQDRNRAEKIITVTVVEKPIFISAPKPAKFIGIAEYDYEFCFNVTGLPKPKLQWFKSTVQFDTTNSRYSVKDSCMNIAKLEKNDVAVYKCTAKNSAGETTATVEIERLGAKPTLDAIPQNLYKANVGSKFELNCSGKGDPVPTLEWSKDGKIISSSKNANVLTINAVKSSDSGNYTCTIRNGLIYKGKEMTESKTISFLAIIKPAVNEIRSNSEVYSYVGNPYTVPMRCVFFGVPTPLVTVYRNGTNLTSGIESVRYDVKTKTIEDFGDYVCTGVNIHGNSSHTVKVLRATAPSKPTEVSAIQTCDTITLEWKPPTDNGHMPIVQYVVKYIDGTRNIPEVNRQYRIPYTFKPKTQYSVKIRARNNAGISLPEKITVKTFEYCAPSIPSIYNLGTEMTGPILEVKWNTPDHDGYDPYITYKVFWRMRTDPPKKWSFSEALDNSTRMYTIPEKLKTGKYEFKVTASNRGGESKPSVRVVKVTAVEEPPVPAKRTGGLSKGVIAGIVIAILLIVLITIDLFCCFFNSCGVIFCCQRACCKKTYEVDGKGKDNEMEKLNKNQKPEPV